MTLRAKLKKTFGKKSASGENTPSGDSTPQRTDIEYYKPHEIPKLKYRGRVDPEHQEKLHAFSFADAFGRRASSMMSGAFSPGGTRAQSRRASWISRTKSNANSDADGKSLRRKSVVPPQLEENPQDDTNVLNAGLSRHVATIDSKSEDIAESSNDLSLEKTVTNGGLEAEHDTPFSPEELEQAMTKVSLKPRDESVLPKGDTTVVQRTYRI